jgi:hypothetical protein
MKKILLASLFFGLLILLVQCTKDKNIDISNEPIVDVDINAITSQFNADYHQFKNGQNFKSEKIVNISDAIYEMDATFNSTYTVANHKCGERQFDEFTISLPIINDSEVEYDKVLSTYDVAINKVNDIIYNMNKSNKQLMSVMIEDDGKESSNERRLKIKTVIGFGLFTDNDFSNDEKYLFNESATYNCDGDPASGAPVVFETKLNEYYNTCSSNGCRYFFYGNATNIYFEANSATQLDFPPDNYCSYKVFYADNSNNKVIDEITQCLEYNQGGYGIHEMQFYYDNYILLINSWLNSPENFDNRKYSPLSRVRSFDYQTDFREIGHKLTLNYRKRGIICTAVEPLGWNPS